MDKWFHLNPFSEFSFASFLNFFREPTIVTPLADFVHEVIPQGQSANLVQNEPIHWIKIQPCSYSKFCFFLNLSHLDPKEDENTFVVIMGLARGYQIWLMMVNIFLRARDLVSFYIVRKKIKNFSR